METLTIAQALAMLKDGGMLAVLLFALIGGARKWWVFGWQYEKICEERDLWRRLALTGTDLAGRAVQLADGADNARRGL